MTCPVLIDPACILVGKAASAVAGTAAAGALDGIASAIQSGVSWIVTNSIDWWVQIPSPDLTSQPAVASLQQWVLPLAAAVAVAAMVAAGAKMALTRKANPLIDASSGLLVIAATSAVGVALPTLLLKAGDAWSNWVLQEAAGGNFAARLTSLLTLDGAAPAVVVILGTVAIIISALQAVLMLFRQAALIVLAGTLPLAAAGTLTSATRPWFKRVTGWMLALIFYKPAAAAVYATAFVLIGKGHGVRDTLMGFVMVLMSLLALPVLIRLFTWTTGQVADSAAGGGFLQTTLSGAVAIGALRGYGGSGGSGATEQARMVSAQLGPSGGAPAGSPPPATGGQPPAAPAPGTAGAPGMPGATAAGSGSGAAAGGAGAAAGSGAGAAGASAAAAGGPAGVAAAGLASGASSAARKAAGAMQPPEGAGGNQ